MDRESLIMYLIDRVFDNTGRKPLDMDKKLKMLAEWEKILFNIPTEFLDELTTLALAKHKQGQVFIPSQIVEAWEENSRRLCEERTKERLAKQPNCSQCNNTGWVLELRKAATRCPNRCLAKTNNDKSQATTMPPEFAKMFKKTLAAISMPKVSLPEVYEYEQ